MIVTPPKPGVMPNDNTVLDTLRCALDQVRALAARDDAPDVYAVVAVDLIAAIGRMPATIFVPPNPGAVADAGDVLKTLRSALEQVRAVAALDHDLCAVIAKLENVTSRPMS